MDTSEEYIEMCRKATEIQTGYKYNLCGGDYIVIGRGNIAHGKGDVEIVDHELLYSGHTLDPMYLPRQDQLQDMFGKAWYAFDNSCRILIIDVLQLIMKEYTKEQVGLMLVMFDKYGKKWNGSEWVKA